MKENSNYKDPSGRELLSGDIYKIGVMIWEVKKMKDNSFWLINDGYGSELCDKQDNALVFANEHNIKFEYLYNLNDTRDNF